MESHMQSLTQVHTDSHTHTHAHAANTTTIVGISSLSHTCAPLQERNDEACASTHAPCYSPPLQHLLAPPGNSGSGESPRRAYRAVVGEPYTR
jgi:hypothetical protein